MLTGTNGAPLLVPDSPDDRPANHHYCLVTQKFRLHFRKPLPQVKLIDASLSWVTRFGQNVISMVWWRLALPSEFEFVSASFNGIQFTGEVC
jgi:hypothetical protein